MAKKIKEMTEQDKQDVLAKLDWEGGYDYFITGSDFPEHTDTTFRHLVKEYKEAAGNLGFFLGELDIGDDEDEDDFPVTDIT